METINQEAQPFDSSACFRRRKFRTEASGLTEVAVNWPPDDLWIKRAKGRKVLTRLLGRGQQEVDVEPGDSDLEVYNAARAEDSPDLTAAEATVLINFLAEIRVMDVELGQTEALLSMQVMRDTAVSHRIKVPNAKQVKDCKRAMDRFIGLPHNLFSNTLNLQATAALYDALSPRAENYVNGVPIIHKDAVIREVVAAMDREVSEGDDEKGF